MGTCLSAEAAGGGEYGNELTAQQQAFKSVSIPLEIQVAHYTPSSFPIIPIITSHTAKIIAKSWERLVSDIITDSSGGTTSGITALYNDFYERLDVLDTSGRFDAVLSRNTDGGTNKIQAKGAILVRIIKFVMAIEGDSVEVQYSLYILGKSHSHKGIRPWQYSIFVQTLLLTISSRLGTGATNDVMEAWVNMFAFVMRSMLPQAIANQVVETEINVNTSSEFASDRVKEELQAVEEMKDIKKRYGAATETTSHSNSRDGSPR